MKKVMVLGLCLLVPVCAFAQNALTLDRALSQSTTYLNGRITAKSKVVVLNFTSKWPELSDYIIEELIGYIVNEGTLTVVDRANLETIRREMDFQLSGEVSDETAQSIGKKLGAQTIISGAITAIGNAYRLRIRAISVESAQILGMQNIDVAQDSRLAALTGTAYAGPVSAETPAPVRQNSFTPSNSAVSVSAWTPNFDPASTVKISSAREYINGQDRDVTILEVRLAGGDGKWAGMYMHDAAVLGKLKNASTGVRLKVIGDGKRWQVAFPMRETIGKSDMGIHQTTVTTKKDTVVEIDIPFSKLRQPNWGKRTVKFDKAGITSINIEKVNANGTGPSILKILDLEAY